eukprot:355213-Chlamydomonas_euryale.AAC.1
MFPQRGDRCCPTIVPSTELRQNSHPAARSSPHPVPHHAHVLTHPLPHQAHKVPRNAQVCAPDRPSLPPAPVRLVDFKSEQQRQKERRDGEERR